MIKSFSLGAALLFTTLVNVESKPYFVVFGDETSDIGNNETYVFGFPTWHSRPSSGPMWNEYLAHYNNYTLINFALPGSVSNLTNLLANEPKGDQYVNSATQFQNYGSVFGNRLNKTAIQSDIAVIQLGFNDLYMSNLPFNSKSVDTNFVNSISSSLLMHADIAYSFGYRNLVVTDIQSIDKMPIAQKYNAQDVENFKNHVDALNEKLRSGVSSYISSKKSELKSFKIFSLNDFYNAATSQDVIKALNLTSSTDSCYPVASTAVFKQACIDSDKIAYYGGTTLNTKLHALLGAAFAETLASSDFAINGTSLVSIIKKYNVTGAGAAVNFMYNKDSVKTGKLDVDEYNFAAAKNNSASLITTKNNDISTDGTDGKVTVNTSQQSSAIYSANLSGSAFALLCLLVAASF
ncbi:hypothetical protein AX774_g2089 [Zancudomyces culisetae]|uniref:Thermolabile hemolysin n=1 Tax=Zancudomyces culisetae TaxID=1213189 RepID=A0A1R1PTY8_ZANCU|nr:hypothetical protein AX774_g2089 [Zancudomyces culisetae]|eukprot:OMH84373.1 hypothetical protein AX774_g2089 [Zancudomyces culisetae]